MVRLGVGGGGGGGGGDRMVWVASWEGRRGGVGLVVGDDCGGGSGCLGGGAGVGEVVVVVVVMSGVEVIVAISIGRGAGAGMVGCCSGSAWAMVGVGE